MSWAETIKINSNMGVPINEQIRNNRFLPIKIIDSTGTYTPEKSGYYKVICIGKGGDSYVKKRSGSNNYYDVSLGGAGGVAIKTYHLNNTQSYTINITTDVTFNSELSATRGTSGSSISSGAAGTATGGDYNYTGLTGEGYTTPGDNFDGASVGCYIAELSKNFMFSSGGVTVSSGTGILNYGYSGGIIVTADNDMIVQSSGGCACIIIPLEYDV